MVARLHGTETPCMQALRREEAPVAAQLPLIKWFDEIGTDDVALVGGKNASLGEMYRERATERELDGS